MEAYPDTLRVVEIEDVKDALFEPWLDLYETAFPPNERMLVSFYLKLLQEKARGGVQDHAVLAGLDMLGSFVGMAHYQVMPELSASLLWHIAVLPARRGHGIGTALYRHILRRIDLAACKILFLEVEIPDQADTEEARRSAERRIDFYHRLGVRRLLGIDYTQSVGWHQPPVPMHIMVHSLVPMDVLSVFTLAQTVFGDAIKQVGKVELEQV